MKLAVEITTCTPSRTGVGYYTEHLVDALLQTRRPGDEVVLLSNREPAPELANRWAPHLRLSAQAHLSHVRAIWMQAEVPRLLTECAADVGVFPNYAVPLASPCPTVVVVHDLAILRMPQHFTTRKRLLMQPMLRPSVAAASVVGTVSEASQRDIMRLLGVGRERIALLPGAAHPSCRPASPEAVQTVRARHGLVRPYVLTVGTIEPRKDLLTLLRAFDRLGPDAENHDLVVVGGRGWKDRGLLRELEARTASRRVRWLGYVTESDLVALYTGADVFVFAATLEGFGLPVLEAMACGTQVIASDIAALREVGGDAPRFVPPGDDAAFACAIATALHEPEGKAAARVAGPARARHFSWTRTAEALWARARVIAPERARANVRADSSEEKVIPPPALAPALPPPPAGLSNAEWALLATVIYADLFDSPLPLKQALRALLGAVLDEAEIRRLARGPVLAPLLDVHPDGYIVLAGREHLVDAMPERELLTRALLERNRRILSSLSSLPFIRALVISGGVAHRNPGPRPDIDFFVVAAPGRAYTAYTMLFLATKLTGTRAIICPNYLVDERELAIAYHRDLFTAHQLVSALPFSGQRAYEALCRTNEAWIRRFFPGFGPRPAEDLQAPPALQRAGEFVLGPVEGLLEGALRWGWRARLRRRAAAAPAGDVILSDGILKLHLSDYRRRVLDRFAGRLESLRVEIESRDQPAALDPVGT